MPSINRSPFRRDLKGLRLHADDRKTLKKKSRSAYKSGHGHHKRLERQREKKKSKGTKGVRTR